MNSISANLNIMIKAAYKASKVLIRDFGELEKLQVSAKGPSDFVTNSDTKVEKIIIEELIKSRKKFSVGGLFAGVGGIEDGVEKAGFKISWANEIDKHACKTYRLNHPSHKLIEEDIY